MVCNACAKEAAPRRGRLAAQLPVSAYANASFHAPSGIKLAFFSSKPRPMELNSCAPEIRCFLLPRQSPSDCLLACLRFRRRAETVVRYGISMADIPLTTGQPDRGAGAYQFSAYTIYDPLVAWEMDVSDRPGKLVPGLATEWKVDEQRQEEMALYLAQGRQVSRRQRLQRRRGDLESGQGAQRQGTAVRQAAERAGQDPPALGGELRQDRRRHGRDHHQDRRFVLPLPDALVPGLQPRAI